MPAFPRLVASVLLARTASNMTSLILVLFALERYGSPELAGLVTFLSIGPGLLMSPLAGTLLDRHGRIRFVVIDYAVAATTYVLIAALALGDRLPAPLLLVIVTVASLTMPLSLAGMRSIFPLLVPRALWERANAIDSNCYVVSSIAGPALAGSLVAAARGEGALLATAVLLAAAALVTRGLPDPRADAGTGASLGADAWAGVQYVARHPTLRALAASVGTANLANGVFFIAVPVLLLRELGAGPAAVGQVFAVAGLSGFLSVLVFGRIGTEGRERYMLAGSLVGSLAGVVIVLVGHSIEATVLGMFVIGIATGPFDIALFTVRQRRTDPAWYGRAFAISMSVNFAGFPIGAAIGGSLVAASVDPALVAAIAVTIVATAFTLALMPRDG